MALNCAALPEQLLESELFGYERGAFTGAQQAKPGQVELASGGVLFLDEVTEMSLSAQAKFLRVLQEREFQRLGGTRLQKANIRVIAATNRDLRKAVERGDFREDLFYRLGVFDIQIPPLRERPADIVPLSETFLQEIGRSFGRPPAGLTREARQALLQYQWPGNVRELRNVLERATILCEDALIDTDHLALQSRARSLRNDTTDLSASNAPRLPRFCTTAGETRRKPHGDLGCHARSSTFGYANTDSRKLLSRNRESVPCDEMRHAPVESNEADPARAVGTLSPLHAQARTMKFTRRRSGSWIAHAHARRLLLTRRVAWIATASFSARSPSLRRPMACELRFPSA